jgi:signal transduction histidine kinase
VRVPEAMPAAPLESVLEAGGIGTWSWIQATASVRLDDRATRLLGLGAGPYEGEAQAVWARLHPEDTLVLVDAAAQARVCGSRFDLELRLRNDGGDARWLQWTGGFLPDGPEAGTCAGIVLDVTTRRRAREELERAGRRESIGVLAEGIAHDFNNVLQTLGAHGEILRARLDGDDERAASVEEIRRAIDRAAGMTRQLLALSRRRAGDARDTGFRNAD